MTDDGCSDGGLVRAAARAAVRDPHLAEDAARDASLALARRPVPRRLGGAGHLISALLWNERTAALRAVAPVPAVG